MRTATEDAWAIIYVFVCTAHTHTHTDWCVNKLCDVYTTILDTCTHTCVCTHTHCAMDAGVAAATPRRAESFVLFYLDSSDGTPTAHGDGHMLPSPHGKCAVVPCLHRQHRSSIAAGRRAQTKNLCFESAGSGWHTFLRRRASGRTEERERETNRGMLMLMIVYLLRYLYYIYRILFST